MKNACGCGRREVGDSEELGLHWRERKKSKEKVNCGYGKLTKREKEKDLRKRGLKHWKRFGGWELNKEVFDCVDS